MLLKYKWFENSKIQWTFLFKVFFFYYVECFSGESLLFFQSASKETYESHKEISLRKKSENHNLFMFNFDKRKLQKLCQPIY